MKEILGQAKSVRQLMSGAKYSIDFYQREYKWQTKQVQELLEDLTEQFGREYDPAHPRNKVRDYGRYFLGSIIVSDKDGQKFLIDGQQRMTTLTLLLIYLYNQLKGVSGAANLADLIYAEQYGEKSFNLDVPDRTPVMSALFDGEMPDDTTLEESQKNLVGRYADMKELFPEELTGTALPYFTDWLIENVYLVQITAHSDDDAYTIFETMNDRGLSLSSVDMLKGYLLANITDPNERGRAAIVWKERIGALTDLGKEEDADAIKAWLRSQYATTMRDRRPKAEPKDFELIWSEFHRWVSKNELRLGLPDVSAPGGARSVAFAQFIRRDLDFYLGWYLLFRKASNQYGAELPTVFYNAQYRFNFQYPLMLAPMRVQDDPQTLLRKARVVAAFADIFIHRRHWNQRSMDYSAIQATLFQVVKDIRGSDLPNLVTILERRLNQEDGFTRDPSNPYGLHGQNRGTIHQILARLTDYLERQSGQAGRYLEYVHATGRVRYEVEHIWANKYASHTAEFPNEYEFQRVRNRIGGLLLLPKSFNASFGAKPYADKLEHYYGQNLLAQSLHPKCYQLSPGFIGFVNNSGLPFHPHPVFTKDDNAERCDLYQQLAAKVWSVDRLQEEANSPV